MLESEIDVLRKRIAIGVAVGSAVVSSALLSFLFLKSPELPVNQFVPNDLSATEVTDESKLEDNQNLLDALNALNSDVNYEELQAQWLNVNLSDYVSAYPDFTGYMQIAGTSIDFPVVQGADNEYYLDRDYEQQSNEAGSPFLDYRNSKEYLDCNNIIYGHNMANGTMFGTLKLLGSQDYYSDNDGLIYYNTVGYKNVFKIYSAYEIDLTSFNFIQTAFADNDPFSDWVQKTKELNQVSELSTVSVPNDTKVLTLVTCTAGGEKRFVVHGYLYNRTVY